MGWPPAVAAVASGEEMVLLEPRACGKLRSTWEKVMGDGQIELLNRGLKTALARLVFGSCAFVSLPQTAQLWFSAQEVLCLTLPKLCCCAQVLFSMSGFQPSVNSCFLL